AWPQRLAAYALFEQSELAAISGDPLLRSLMESAPVSDFELERLLTAARAAMLEIATTPLLAAAAKPAGDGEVLDLACALARQLRASIPALTLFEDETSRKVRQQYEENPYPRWTKAAPPPQPLAFDQYLRNKLPAAAFRRLEKPEIDVLIAGCGTGQHAIETA